MKQKTITKNLPLIYRYPRTGVSLLTAAGLLIFFSRPIYDIFFHKEEIDLEELLRNHKSRFGKS
jgi:hypothetical protein